MTSKVDNPTQIYPAELPVEILQCTGAIHSVESIGTGNRCWKIISSDGRAYILKKIFLLSCRIRDFKSICRKSISGFQKVIRICNASNKDEYWVLNEWVSGSSFSPVQFSLQNEEQKSRVKQIADRLRRIHLENETNSKVILQEDALRSNLNCNFIERTTREILLSYMSDKLPLLQARRCTIVHGDLHIRNIVLTKDNDITFIDMEDVRYGDPYIDFVYASNLICSDDEYYTYYLLLNYYFENDPPEEFWPVVNFYSIIKAINIMRSEAARSIDRRPILSIEGLIRQHRGFTEEQPFWYTQLREKLGGKPDYVQDKN